MSDNDGDDDVFVSDGDVTHRSGEEPEVRLEYPTVVPVEVQAPAPPRPLHLRHRFSKAAFKVLTQIIDERAAVESVSSDKVAPPSVSGDSSSKHGGSVSGMPRAKRKKKRPRTNMFASMVRMAQVRHHLNKSERGHRKNTHNEAEDDIPAGLDPDKLRFCATLSPEAQYAMLKGYEDILISGLQTVYPENKVQLYRVKTPNKDLKALKLSSPEPHKSAELQPQRKAFDSVYLTEDAGRHTRGENTQTTVTLLEVPNTNNHNKRMPHYSTNSSTDELPSVSTSMVNREHRHHHQNARSYDFQHQNQKHLRGSHHRHRQPTVSTAQSIEEKQKQMRLSYRFQTAMDLLDQLNSCKNQTAQETGSNTNSKRPAPKSFNNWCQHWCKEFQFELPNKPLS